MYAEGVSGSTLIPQMLKVLVQGLYLAKVLPDCPLSTGKQGNRATASKYKERGRIIVSQVKPFLPPPFHRHGRGDFKVRIYSVPWLDIDDHTPGGH
jgi:hypothetical protein